jgi:hypothetical protein
MIRRQGLAGRHVRDAGHGLDSTTGPIGHGHRSGDSGFEHRFEVLLDFCHEVA